jgi:hypothetical protein
MKVLRVLLVAMFGVFLAAAATAAAAETTLRIFIGGQQRPV